jgi:hypothetical protein
LNSAPGDWTHTIPFRDRWSGFWQKIWSYQHYGMDMWMPKQLGGMPDWDDETIQTM